MRRRGRSIDQSNIHSGCPGYDVHTIAESGAAGEAGSRRWDLRLIYLLAVIITTSQGVLELTFPLDLHRLGFSLPLVGAAVAALGLGQILSRLPGGVWYRLAWARWLCAAALTAFSLSTIGLGYAQSWHLLAALAAVHGFGFGLVTTYMLAMLIDIRPPGRRVAATMAWYTAAISAGYAVGAPLGAQAIVHLGYTPAFWVSGLIGLSAAALCLALRLEVGAAGSESAPALRRPRLGALGALLSLPAGVWLATLLVFYINFISDLLGAFFPIYAVGIGIPIAFIGILKSVNSLSATSIRFAAAGIFRFLEPGLVNHASVVAMAMAVVGVSLFTSPAWLLALFALIGVSRGLIRVTSATSVAEERARPGTHTGLSSGVYNAGLDAGSMLAPPLGGALAGVIGIPGSFQAAAVALSAFYYGAWLWIRSRPGGAAQSLPSASAE